MNARDAERHAKQRQAREERRRAKAADKQRRKAEPGNRTGRHVRADAADRQAPGRRCHRTQAQVRAMTRGRDARLQSAVERQPAPVPLAEAEPEAPAVVMAGPWQRFSQAPAVVERRRNGWQLTPDERRQIAEALQWDPGANKVSPIVVIVARRRRAERQK